MKRKKKEKKIGGDIIILHIWTKNLNHMMYGSWDTKREWQNFLSIWAIFCPFTILTNRKIKILKIEKTLLEMPSFFHMCTKNHNHMMYGSWDIDFDRHNFLSFWVMFCPFTALRIRKNKILKEWEKRLEIALYTSVPKIMIICYTVPEICRVTDVIFIFHFGVFFCPFTTPFTVLIEVLLDSEKCTQQDLHCLVRESNEFVSRNGKVQRASKHYLPPNLVFFKNKNYLISLNVSECIKTKFNNNVYRTRHRSHWI